MLKDKFKPDKFKPDKFKLALSLAQLSPSLLIITVIDMVLMAAMVITAVMSNLAQWVD